MQLSIKVENLREVQNAIEQSGKQARFAAARALTDTAESARKDATARLAQVIKGPTPYTLNSLFKKPATKVSLASMVYVKDRGREQKTGSRGPDRIIGHLFKGGARESKNFELVLRRAGLLPPGFFAVPGNAAPRDGNGNIPPAFITQMLAYFRAFGEQGYQANMTDKSRARFEKRLGKKAGGTVEFFISRGRGFWFGRRSWREGRRQHLPPGVWQRVRYSQGSAIRPVLMFVKAPRYQQLINLEEIVGATARREFPAKFRQYYAEALATAR